MRPIADSSVPILDVRVVVVVLLFNVLLGVVSLPAAVLVTAALLATLPIPLPDVKVILLHPVVLMGAGAAW